MWGEQNGTSKTEITEVKIQGEELVAHSEIKRKIDGLGVIYHD